jgi:histidinol phosphatase-like PHP family hydrolase
MNPIAVDFHVHTHLSPCGRAEATAAAMVYRAKARGMSALGFADHITSEPVPGCDFYDGQQSPVLSDLRLELEKIGPVEDLEVLRGFEADYTVAGARCVDRDLLVRADYVIGSASHFDLPTAPQPAVDSPGVRAELMMRMAREMLSVPGISVWAHPFDCSSMRPLAPIAEAMDRAALTGLVQLANVNEVAIEINGGSAERIEYREAMADFFHLAHHLGATFTIASDAHHPDGLDQFDLALEWARSLGIRDQALLTVSDLRERQNRKRRRFIETYSYPRRQDARTD